jgi:integrase
MKTKPVVYAGIGLRARGYMNDESELSLLQGVMQMQRETGALLRAHRRKVALNKLLPKGTPEQREVALGGLSDDQLLAMVTKVHVATAATYRSRARSVYEDAQKLGVNVWRLVDERAGNVDSWYTFKAGLQHYLEEEVVSAKRALDAWQRDRKAHGPSTTSNDTGKAILKRLGRFADALEAVPATAPVRFKGDGRSKRHATKSKSRSITAVSPIWREQAVEHMSGDLRLLFLLQCTTGCRPQELANGVQVRLLRDGSLVARVKGAKTSRVAGQPVRSIRLRTSDGVVHLLAKELKVGVTLHSKSLALGQVDTYGVRVARACAKAYPERKRQRRLSAYSARHQFKADLVAAGWPRDEIAMAMGHSTTRSGTAYGKGGKSGGGGVKPVAVKARRPVKQRSPHPRPSQDAAPSFSAKAGLPTPRKRRANV